MADFFDFKAVGGVLAMKASPTGLNVTVWDFGWVDDPVAVAAVAAAQTFADAGRTPVGATAEADLPPFVYLWKAFFKLFGKNPPPRNQKQVGSCFPPGTRVRMADGTHRPIEQVRLNEKVLTAEGNTGRVRTLFARHEAECVLRIRCHGHYGIRATREHPVLTKRGYVPAEQLTVGDLVAVPRYLPATTNSIVTAEHRGQMVRVRNEARERVFAGVPGRKPAVVQVAAVPDVILLTPGVGRIMGLFLAEGCTDKNKVVWTFNSKELNTLAAELVSLLSVELGATAHVQERFARNTCKVSVHGRVWAELFKSLCGNGSGQKQLHPDIASGPVDFLEALYEGWMAGDGHEKRISRQGVTVSHDLALSMFDIVNYLGKQPAIRHSDPKISHGVKVRQRRYDLEVSTGGGKNRPPIDAKAMWRKVASIDTEEYQGDVYNIEVEGDNSYVAEGIGVHNCVSFGTNKAVESTMAVEIALKGEAEEWKDIAQEVTYGGSRVEVGNGRIRGDGSVGAWAAEFVRRWGVVARGVYGSVDLSAYSEQRCREYGDKGVPAELETLAREHPVKDTTLVTTRADAKKMLAAGYGLAVCSNQGFSMTRDANGVCRPSGNWGHCMAIDGYHTDAAGDLWFHVVNSWGPDAHTGPTGWGDPGTDGFWASADVVDGMIAAGDTWAFAAVQGFPARVIDWSTVL